MKNKNIHILPTDKPSRLVKSIVNNNLLLADVLSTNKRYIKYNIYITSDEEIKEGDWFICLNTNIIQNILLGTEKKDNCKKIILTDNQDLIKDGVQPIPDDFLEWFVKNPSCEEVDLIKLRKEKGYEFLGYEIIIPKEEPKQHVELINDNIEEFDKAMEFIKQETLEEVADNYARKQCEDMYDDEGLTGANWGWEVALDFKEGAKWQAERMYNEEEVMEMFDKLSMHLPLHYEMLVKEMFKKK